MTKETKKTRLERLGSDVERINNAFTTIFEAKRIKSIVIVDIDGTIADCSERAGKYLCGEKKDWDSFYEACDQDKPIHGVIDIVKTLSVRKTIVFMTGRRESTRKKTQDWIRKHMGVMWCPDDYDLYMRADDDHRHDTIVKPEMMAKAGIRKDDVFCVLEDRNSVVRMWRDMGLTCLQVAEGDF